MSTRRGFLTLLGLAPAAALAPRMLDSGKPTDIALTTIAHPVTDLPTIETLAHAADGAPMRYLGLAQLKTEGEPFAIDEEDEA